MTASLRKRRGDPTACSQDSIVMKKRTEGPVLYESRDKSRERARKTSRDPLNKKKGDNLFSGGEAGSHKGDTIGKDRRKKGTRLVSRRGKHRLRWRGNEFTEIRSEWTRLNCRKAPTKERGIL